MSPALTLALCLRDDETRLADMARAAVSVAEAVSREHAAGEWRDGTREEATIAIGGDAGGDLDFEILALDERSRDNTLSVLSILHARLPQLRTIQGLAPGSAVMRAARTARGRAWLIVDAPFDAERGLWAMRQVLRRDDAAIVPGELLAVRRAIGQAALGWHRGGLAGAQLEVERLLGSHGRQPALCPPHDRALRTRARLFVRARLGRVGLGAYDRAP